MADAWTPERSHALERTLRKLDAAGFGHTEITVADARDLHEGYLARGRDLRVLEEAHAALSARWERDAEASAAAAEERAALRSHVAGLVTLVGRLRANAQGDLARTLDVLEPLDFACAACCVPPYATDSVVAGFACAYHAALQTLTDRET